MKIDAHQHFWKYNSEEYSWINDDMQRIRKNLLPEDLKPLLAAKGFDGTVVVQARQTLQETEWLLQLADTHDFIKGVVGWVDLCAEDVGRQLERFSSHKKFVGVRHSLQDEPNDYFMLGKDFLRGIALLKEFDLTYDILVHPRHLPVAVDFVRHFPGQPFVLDHLAKPFIKKQELTPWDENIEALAAFPNVCCKISGMVTEANWNQWRPEDFYPYVETVYRCFGEDRIMIGSDWPVCLVAANDYEEVMNLPLQYFKSKGLSEDAMSKFMGLNCKRFYGLE